MKQIPCWDMNRNILNDGDFVDVQKAGVHQIYKKEDNQLWFNPYPNKYGEEQVITYFSNDLAKCDKDGNWIGNEID